MLTRGSLRPYRGVVFGGSAAVRPQATGACGDCPLHWLAGLTAAGTAEAKLREPTLSWTVAHEVGPTCALALHGGPGCLPLSRECSCHSLRTWEV